MVKFHFLKNYMIPVGVSFKTFFLQFSVIFKDDRENNKSLFLKIKIGDNERPKNQAGNTIGGKKGEVHFGKIIGLHNCVLVKQQAQKNRHRYPMNGADLRIIVL